MKLFKLIGSFLGMSSGLDTAQKSVNNFTKKGLISRRLNFKCRGWISRHKKAGKKTNMKREKNFPHYRKFNRDIKLVSFYS